jgi:hypothetical protein
MRRSAIIVVLLVLGVACIAYAAARDFWTAEFKHTGLQYITVKDPVLGGNAIVPYTTYTVTNGTGADRDVQPIFQVETETGQTTYAIPSPEVVKEINRKHGKTFIDVDKIAGTLKDGEMKEGVAVFRNLDAGADHVKVYVSGLTDAFRYQDRENRKGFQRRVYYVYWYRPGDAENRAVDRTDTKHDDWIWRSTDTAETAPEAK